MAGRGLCWTCSSRNRRGGTLCDYERVTRSSEEVLAEWVRLRDDGISTRDAAPRLGMTLAALMRAQDRAVARGDSRGRRTAYGRKS